MKKTAKKMMNVGLVMFALATVIFLATPAPILASGVSLLGPPPKLIVCGTTDTKPNCSFADLFLLGTNIIKFIFYLSIPATVVGFSYAGWLYLTAGGNEGKTEEARKIFKNVAIGFVWICVAWALVYTIVSPFLNTGSGYKLFSL
jgi:hypothetical protein